MKTERSYCIDIFGDGDEKKCLERKNKSLGIDSVVSFKGKVSFEEMQRRYMESDVYILPSLRETTGTAVLEAMANKLPVICLNQNGAKHIVESDAGILIDVISHDQVIEDMAKALDRLVEDEKSRIEMGNRGYEKLREKYTWSKRAEMMSGVYNKLCQED